MWYLLIVNLDPAIYKKHPKEEVEKAIELLTYKNISPMVKEESQAEPTIYVFRHGQSTDNEAFIFSGWRDVHLTELGKQQAQVLAEKLKTKKLDMLISSDQIRTIETMQIAVALNDYAKNREIYKDKRIRERSYGDLQGTSKLEMFFTNPELLHEYRRSYTKKATNGESLEDTVKRVESFCAEITPLMKIHKLNVAVSCHSNSMRALRKYFEHLTIEQTCAEEDPLGQDYCSYIVK